MYAISQIVNNAPLILCLASCSSEGVELLQAFTKVHIDDKLRAVIDQAFKKAKSLDGPRAFWFDHSTTLFVQFLG